MKLLLLFCFLESKASISNHCSCKKSWSKHLVGTEFKCFKFIGRIKIKDAKSSCEKIGSTLPVPETMQENLDLLKMGSKCIVVTNETIVDRKKPTPGQPYPNFPWLTLGYDPTQSHSAKKSFSNWMPSTYVAGIKYASLVNRPQSQHGKWRPFSGLIDSWTVCQLQCYLSNTTLTSPVRISTLTYLSTTVPTLNLSPTYASQNNLIELRRMVDLHTKIYVDRTLRQLTNFNDKILKDKIVKFNLTSVSNKVHGQPELEDNEELFKSTMNTLFNMLLTSSKNKRTLNTSSLIIKMLAALVKGGCSTLTFAVKITKEVTAIGKI